MTRHPDPFEDALEDLRISGMVLLHEAYSPPWAISVPEEARLREVLNVNADVRVLPFHLVRKNSFELRVEGQRAVAVNTSEVAICPSGAAHVMSSGNSTRAFALDAIIRGDGPTPAGANDEAATELVCGVFMAHAAPLNPMLGALPAVVKVSTIDDVTNPMLSSAAAMLSMALKSGSRGGYTAARLLEIFCAEAIRAYQRSGAGNTSGWFKGLADPKIAKAIREVHADPARDWAVENLANIVALSPSRFAARFRETTGQSVMGYVARWRANLACRLLRDTELPLIEIANRAGYESLPAFSRAFKTQFGVPPAAWRLGRKK